MVIRLELEANGILGADMLLIGDDDGRGAVGLPVRRGGRVASAVACSRRLASGAGPEEARWPTSKRGKERVPGS